MKKVKILVAAAILAAGFSMNCLNASEDWSTYPKTEERKCFYERLLNFRDILSMMEASLLAGSSISKR